MVYVYGHGIWAWRAYGMVWDALGKLKKKFYPGYYGKDKFNCI